MHGLLDDWLIHLAWLNSVTRDYINIYMPPYVCHKVRIAMHDACASLYWIMINVALVMPKNRYELRPTDIWSCSHFPSPLFLYTKSSKPKERHEARDHKLIHDINQTVVQSGGVWREHTTLWPAKIITYNGPYCSCLLVWFVYNLWIGCLDS